MKQGFGVSLSNVENRGRREDKGDSRRRKKKNHKNPSHKPFKPRQSLRPSQSGQEPERNVEGGAEHRTGTFCFLIWNLFFFCPLSVSLLFFLVFPSYHFSGVSPTSGLDSSLVPFIKTHRRNRKHETEVMRSAVCDL